jgi:hypothetical protein
VGLVLRGVAPLSPTAERRLHARFRRWHSHREWYVRAAEMLADIDALLRGGAPPDDAEWFALDRAAYVAERAERERIVAERDRLDEAAAEREARRLYIPAE